MNKLGWDPRPIDMCSLLAFWLRPKAAIAEIIHGHTLTRSVSFDVALFGFVIKKTLEIAETFKPEAQAKPCSFIKASLALQA